MKIGEFMNEQQIKKTASKVKLYGDLDSVILSLINYKNAGENVYVDFNGTNLYSLLDTVDSCYIKITGMNRNDYIEAKARMIEERFQPHSFFRKLYYIMLCSSSIESVSSETSSSSSISTGSASFSSD